MPLYPWRSAPTVTVPSTDAGAFGAKTSASRWYHNIGPSTEPATNSLVNMGFPVAQPVRFQTAKTLSGLAMKLSAAASSGSSAIRFAIYDSDPYDMPSNLAYDSGSIGLNGLTIAQCAPNVTLTAGLWWVAQVTTAVPGFVGATGNVTHLSAALRSTNYGYYVNAFVMGIPGVPSAPSSAFPATISDASQIDSGYAGSPFMWFKFSA